MLNPIMGANPKEGIKGPLPELRVFEELKWKVITALPKKFQRGKPLRKIKEKPCVVQVASIP